MTPNHENRHAYFPVLFHCVAFLEFWSSLYCGNFKRDGFEKIKENIKQYMNYSIYSEHLVKLLYFGIRHKVAHQSSPNFVIDTTGRVELNKIFYGDRFTWYVSE